MSFTIIAAILLALIVYVVIGFVVGRRTKGVADLLPLASGRQAKIKSSAEFSTSTVATTVSLATVIMAFFELSRYLGLWLLWTVITTVAGQAWITGIMASVSVLSASSSRCAMVS